jgi:parvulin-like peptidyl-prolyl isomerase
MIIFLRKQLYRNRYFLVFIVGLMIFLMAMPALFRSMFKSSNSGSYFAKVNGMEIGYRDFMRRAQANEEQMQFMQYQAQQMGVAQNPQMPDPRQLAFTSLIEDAIIDGVVRKLHIPFDEQYISTKIMDPYYVIQELYEFVPSYLVASGQPLTDELLSRVLRHKGVTIAEFEAFIEQNLARKLVKQIVANGAYVPNWFLRIAYTQEYAAKKFSLVTFPLSIAAGHVKKEAITPQELNQFFTEQNEKYGRYIVPEKRSGAVWEFSAEKYGISISEAQIREFYQQSVSAKKDLFKIPAQLKVRRILFKIDDNAVDANVAQVNAESIRQELLKSPERFAQKAKEVSQDEASVKSGGVIGFFARGEKDAEFERAAFDLKKDGDISEVIRTKDGIEILQRVEKKAASYKTLASVSEAVKELLLAQQFKEKFARDMASLQEKAKTDPEAIGRFTAEKHAKKTNFENSSLDLRNSLLVRLFKMKSLGSSYSREGNQGFLVQLNRIQKTHTPEIAAVKEQVMNDLYHLKAMEFLVNQASQARVKLGTQSIDGVVKEYRGTLSSINWFKGSDTERVKKLTNEHLPVGKLLQMENVGSTLLFNGPDFVGIVRLDDVEKVDQVEFETKKSQLWKSLYRKQGVTVFAGFIASLSRNATLEVNEKAFETGLEDN